MDDTQQLIEKLFDSKLDGLKDLLTGVKEDIEKLDAKMEAHITTGEQETQAMKASISALQVRITQVETKPPKKTIFEIWKEESIKWAVPIFYLVVFWLIATNGANLWTTFSKLISH